MDGSRTRRTRDAARKLWYATYRQWRFARHYGFGEQARNPMAAVTARVKG